MSHPVYFPGKSYFYPIGNTAPVSLTQHLPPEEPATVLLLGCGDPRNILFTVHTDHAIGPRKLDVTCCDWEPGTLARNAILLTLIADTDEAAWSTKLWNIFYHLNIDRPSLELLSNHCQKLIDISSDLATWNASTYARFLRLCSSQTLSTLRGFWKEYLRLSRLSPHEQSVLNQKFVAGKQSFKSWNIMTAARNTGPLIMSSPESGSFADEHYRFYWDTGVIPSEKKHLSEATFANPTMAYSSRGEEFSVHYGTDPILGFHLAPAFAPLMKDSFSSSAVQNVGLCAKSQFVLWCKSFHDAVAHDLAQPSVVIRLQVGEALSFCYALRLRSLGLDGNGPFASFWGSERITLDDPPYEPSQSTNRAPTSFNMVDSSNLTDHLGLINMLVAVTPVLSPSQSTVFVTETLLSTEETRVKAFESRVFADAHAMALLLGLVPAAYDSLFTSQSSHHEIALELISSSPQAHETIAWKLVPRSGHRDLHPPGKVGFDAKQLARLVFDVYLKMFDEENISSTLRSIAVSKASGGRRVQSLSLIHYNRRSFALFLRSVMDNVLTDWPSTMTALINLIETDQTLMLGSNNYQDLCCQLHLLGVYTVPPLRPNQTAVQVDDSRGRFSTWNDIPPVVCVTLVVPREKIDLIAQIDANKIGTPIFQTSILHPSGHNIISYLQIMFGKCSTTGQASDPTVHVEEDPAGWKGRSPLAVSFWMPSWILRQQHDGLKVCLGVYQTPSAVAVLRPKLGAYLTLFEADITNKNAVLLSRERPGFHGELALTSKVFPPQGVSPPVGGGMVDLKVHLDDTTLKPKVVKLRLRIDGGAHIASLGGGAKVSVEQTSSSSVSVTFDDFKRELVFPLAVDGRHLKTLVARKSLYIEIQALLPKLDDPLSFYVNAAPVPTTTSPILSTFHHLRLDLMPALSTKNSSKLKWLNAHAQLAMSDQEIAQYNSGKTAPEKILYNVKQSINIMLDGFCGLNAERKTVYGLMLPPDVGVYTLIFIQDLRLDLASHTVVLDACVLPLTRSNLSDVMSDIQKITGKGVMQIVTAANEMRVWKQLLAAFAERCRTWSHTPNCEYAAEGRTPLSYEPAEDPICSCGKGKNLGNFISMYPYPSLVPHVTRVAISLLFAVSYLEPIGSHFRDAISDQPPRPRGSGDNVCHMCAGPGKPSLLLCSKCRNARYCSADCQAKAWAQHKKTCRK
ncbi:hypothetical protein HGRIS_010272 [Hohenbuehelia grisea]|uniref:MYND-type domain-containing protein n=1 Tax=Hohenbuehelia grisea TaxID=104357 RepID=A0ABR3J464_9AGAR